MKKRRLILATLTIIAILATLSFMPIFQMKKIIRNPTGELRSGQSFTREEINKIEKVLKNYGEKYKISGNKIFINYWLSKDYDLLANYYTKSQDSEWLNKNGS